MLCPASYQYLNMHTLHLSKITKHCLMPVLLFLAGNKILFCHKPTLVLGPIFSYSLMSCMPACFYITFCLTGPGGLQRDVVYLG
jgi:hypothetical protein